MHDFLRTNHFSEVLHQKNEPEDGRGTIIITLETEVLMLHFQPMASYNVVILEIFARRK